MNIACVQNREDLEGIRASTQEALVIEYWLAGTSGLDGRSPILEFVRSDDGERSVYFGGGSTVRVDPDLLEDLIKSSFDELESWAARTQDILANTVKDAE